MVKDLVLCTKDLIYNVVYDPYTSEKDFRKILDRWQQNYLVDAIFLAGQLPKAADFINIARERGVETPVIGGLAMDRKALLKLLNSLKKRSQKRSPKRRTSILGNLLKKKAFFSEERQEIWHLMKFSQ